MGTTFSRRMLLGNHWPGSLARSEVDRTRSRVTRSLVGLFDFFRAKNQENMTACQKRVQKSREEESWTPLHSRADAAVYEHEVSHRHGQTIARQKMLVFVVSARSALRFALKMMMMMAARALSSRVKSWKAVQLHGKTLTRRLRRTLFLRFKQFQVETVVALERHYYSSQCYYVARILSESD